MQKLAHCLQDTIDSKKDVMLETMMKMVVNINEMVELHAKIEDMKGIRAKRKRKMMKVNVMEIIMMTEIGLVVVFMC